MRPRSTTSTPAAVSSLLSWRQRNCCSAISSPAAMLICSNCSVGVRPSADSTRTRSRCWPFRPATRVMKNSSRLLAEIDRKRSRSRSGWFGLAASSSTRSLNASQEISRLKKREGEAISASLSASCGAREAGTSWPREMSSMAASLMESVVARDCDGRKRAAGKSLEGREERRPARCRAGRASAYCTTLFGAAPAGQSPRRLASMVMVISAICGGTFAPLLRLVISTL